MGELRRNDPKTPQASWQYRRSMNRASGVSTVPAPYFNVSWLQWGAVLRQTLRLRAAPLGLTDRE